MRLLILFVLLLAIRAEESAQSTPAPTASKSKSVGSPPEPASERARAPFLACRGGNIDECSSFIALMDAEPNLEGANHAALLAEALYTRGQSSLQKGYTVVATDDFQRLLQLQPNALAAHIAVADAWSASGERERAVALFTQILRQRSMRRLPAKVRALVLVRRASAFAEMKNHSLAVRDLDAALQMDSSVSNAMQIHRNRALSYAQLGNASFAIDDLNKLVQLQTRRDFVEPEAFFLRAMCFALQHQHILAIKDFDRAFEVNAKLKKHPRTDPVTGKVYKFSGSLEVRIEQQRVAVQNTLRGTSTMPARQQMGSEERSEQMRSVLDGHYRNVAAGVLSEESRAAGWRVAQSPDDLPKGELPESTGERPSSEQVAAREAEIANILQQHYAPKTEL